ncbi:hypothetical protein HPGAM_06945 [Helicobacter pylori Gambia94/24]|nr:hypothetical protein HPGAM_06945 [Helicobacter pylori Gambia94/24]
MSVAKEITPCGVERASKSEDKNSMKGYNQPFFLK